MPVILATQEAEIRRIMVGSQPGQKVHKTLSQKKKKKTEPSQKRAGGVAQGGRACIQTPVLQENKTKLKQRSLTKH
jgi:hypothetical protein